ncbi:MAG: uncharacterized protein KVP18_000342 [Porospora cf. gigantea A]|uniref:uncharacterized protein n=1 Tax=Porospora cf. gigantea A TaxID=2853593 RepID=UPI00355A4610|nr:MAG: hypothetical protein KVP18_000342 [Porospora cf. gigantea A]
MPSLGFVGYGLRGGLMHDFSKVEGVTVAALCDSNPAVRRRFEKSGDLHNVFGNILVTESYDELMSQPLDAVVVLSPDNYHWEHATKALEAGKHVYVEKPLAISVEQCDSILLTAMRCRRKLFVGHNMRYFPVIKRMKELLDGGVIGVITNAWCRHFVAYGGEAYFKDWHSERCNTTGLLLQKGAHDIDVIHWLCGAYTTSAVGMGQLAVFNQCERRKAEDRADFSQFGSPDLWPPTEQKGCSPVIDVEDSSMMLMTLTNGVQASYQQVMYSPDSCRNYTFIGQQGRIENIGDGDGAEIHIYTDRHCNFGRPNRLETVVAPQGAHSGADPMIAREFVGVITGNIDRPLTDPVAARMAVAATCAATHSLRVSKATEKVEPLGAEILEYYCTGQRCL